MSRFAAWLACIAILVASLAPTVSLALSAERTGASLGELCGATGAKRFSIWADNLPDPSPVKKDGQHFKHCLFCQLLGALAGLPPADGFMLPVPGIAHRVALLPSFPPRPQVAWAAGQPRGPPAFS